jgi:hypothetical protein
MWGQPPSAVRRAELEFFLTRCRTPRLSLTSSIGYAKIRLSGGSYRLKGPRAALPPSPATSKNDASKSIFVRRALRMVRP